MKLNKKKILIGAVAVIVILVFLVWIDVVKAILYLKNIYLPLFFLAVLVVVFTHIFKALRFYYLARDLKAKIGFLETLFVHFKVAIVGRVTPVKLGEAVKVWMFKEDKKDLGFCFLLEKIIDTITVMIVAFFGILAFSVYIKSYILVAALFLVALIVIFNIEKILNFVLKKDIFEKNWFMKKLKGLSFKGVAIFVLNSIIIRILVLTMPYIIARAFNINISFFSLAVIYSISMLIGFVSGLPGGFGPRELSLAYLVISYVVITKEIAGIFALMVTFTDLSVESVLAVFSYGKGYMSKAR